MNADTMQWAIVAGLAGLALWTVGSIITMRKPAKRYVYVTVHVSGKRQVVRREESGQAGIGCALILLVLVVLVVLVVFAASGSGQCNPNAAGCDAAAFLGM